MHPQRINLFRPQLLPPFDENATLSQASGQRGREDGPASPNFGEPVNMDQPSHASWPDDRHRTIALAASAEEEIRAHNITKMLYNNELSRRFASEQNIQHHVRHAREIYGSYLKAQQGASSSRAQNGRLIQENQNLQSQHDQLRRDNQHHLEHAGRYRARINELNQQVQQLGTRVEHLMKLNEEIKTEVRKLTVTS